MRYGRRRRRFPWVRVLWTGLATLGALSLLLFAVNWRSLLGLYRINRVSGAVRRLDGVLEVAPDALRARRLSETEAASELQRGLADLGIPGRVTLRR